jgi:hypothetical protein
MGVSTMRCSLNILVPAMILAAPAVGLAQLPTYKVGNASHNAISASLIVSP